MLKNTNYYEKLVQNEGKEIADYLIDNYKQVNKIFSEYGSKQIDPIFSAYLESRGYPQDYLNIKNYQQLVDYSLDKLLSFIEKTATPFNNFQIVYNGKNYTLSYAELYDLLKSGQLNSFFNSNEKPVKLFSDIWDLLKEQDVNYQFRKKTDYYKTEI